MEQVGREPHPLTKFGSPEHAALLTADRFIDIQDALQWLAFSHLPEPLQKFSAPFYSAAVVLLGEVATDSFELITAMSKLIEAKDAAMRAGIRHQTGRAGSIPRPQTVVDPPRFGNFGPGQPRQPDTLRPPKPEGDWAT